MSRVSNNWDQKPQRADSAGVVSETDSVVTDSRENARGPEIHTTCLKKEQSQRLRSPDLKTHKDVGTSSFSSR